RVCRRRRRVDQAHAYVRLHAPANVQARGIARGAAGRRDRRQDRCGGGGDRGGFRRAFRGQLRPRIPFPAVACADPDGARLCRRGDPFSVRDPVIRALDGGRAGGAALGLQPTRRIMKRVLVALAAVSVSLAVAACGQKREQINPTTSQGTTLMLDWFPNADHVGVYRALAQGEFKRAGLNVHVAVPSDPSTPLRLLAAGKVDFAVSYEPEVMLARNRGEPVVAVAALVQKPLTSIISLGHKHISRPAQLRGKRVGDAGIPYQHAYLQTILAHAHVPSGSVKEINVGSDLVPALLSGRVDAILGGYWNYEAIQLAQLKKRPHVLRMDKVGVPTYDELVVGGHSHFV